MAQWHTWKKIYGTDSRTSLIRLIKMQGLSGDWSFEMEMTVKLSETARGVEVKSCTFPRPVISGSVAAETGGSLLSLRMTHKALEDPSNGWRPLPIILYYNILRRSV